MSTRLLVIAIVLTTINVTAQEQTEIIPKAQPGKNEAGAFIEPITSGNFNGSYNAYAGILYKRWAKPNKAYRIIGAIGDYIGHSYPTYVEKRGDTLLQKHINTHVPMYFLGGGVEVQRQFYKKVVLYAAIELKAGYGSGEYHEVQTKVLESEQGIYMPGMYFEANNVGTHRVTAFTVDASPFIGAKLNFRRLSLGTEVTVINIGLESLQYENMPAYSGTTNFTFGDFRQRLYLNYRF